MRKNFVIPEDLLFLRRLQAALKMQIYPESHLVFLGRKSNEFPHKTDIFSPAKAVLKKRFLRNDNSLYIWSCIA